MPPARHRLVRFAWLSVAAAVATISLKFTAYLLTGSVGLLSDAAESVVNLVAAFVALIVLRVAAQPADEQHQFGHAKAEYFAAAIEGVMILVAALVIVWTAVVRFLHPLPLVNVGIGLGVSIVASAVNGIVGVVLLRAGRRHRSITLVADGKHLLTDVWTSAGIVLGVALVAATDLQRLDPVVAFLVGVNIIRTHLAMDVLVPGKWTVQRGHDLLEEIETRFSELFDGICVDTHLEPLEDPRAYEPELDQT